MLKRSMVEVGYELLEKKQGPQKFNKFWNEVSEILGLDENLCTGSSNQRKLCLCPCCKTELLNNRTRCEHKCLYCYWKD